MGNFFSKIFGKSSTPEPDNSNTHIEENEIDNCEVIQQKLSELFEKASTITDEKELAQIYNVAKSYVECNSTEVEKMKTSIYEIYQALLYKNALNIFNSYSPQLITEDMTDVEKHDTLKINYNLLIELSNKLQPYMSLYTINDEISKLINGINEQKTFIENTISELNGTIRLLQIKRLASFIYCGYGVSCSSYYDPSTATSEDGILTNIKKIIKNNLNEETYDFLLQFSELLYLLYPIEIVTDENNSSVVNASVLKDYIKEDGKLYKHLQLLGIYYSLHYYYNPDLDSTDISYEISSEYETRMKEAETYINKQSTSDSLYNETKELFKKQSIEHWKGLPFMAQKRFSYEIQINYIPSNLPVYYPKYEQYLACVWVTNLIFYKLGDINQGGQYTYNSISPLTYDEVFKKEAWDRKTKIETSTINVEKPKTIYETWYNYVMNNPNMTKEQYDKIDSKTHPLKLTSDEYNSITKAINHTAHITDKFLQKVLDEVFSIPPLGAYELVNTNYMINYNLIPNFLKSINGDKDIDYFALRPNNFLISAIEYMCECFDKKYNSNFSELMSQLYYTIKSAVSWDLIFPIQTLKINMTINHNDNIYLQNNFSKLSAEDRYDHMIDRCTLFQKSNGKF